MQKATEEVYAVAFAPVEHPIWALFVGLSHEWRMCATFQ